jgi:hypothetical protein
LPWCWVTKSMTFSSGTRKYSLRKLTKLTRCGSSAWCSFCSSPGASSDRMIAWTSKRNGTDALPGCHEVSPAGRSRPDSDFQAPVRPASPIIVQQAVLRAFHDAGW